MSKEVENLTLGELKSLVSMRGEAALERLYATDPVLVIRLNDTDDVAIFNTPLGARRDELKNTAVETQPIEGTAVIEGTGLRDKVTRATSRVVRIKKSDRNPFAGLVTVGRARNNDLCLYSSRVSKMHGWLRQSTMGWVIKDHNSTNGVFVNGERLPAGGERALRSGDELCLGDLEALFLDMPGLHALCGMVGE